MRKHLKRGFTLTEAVITMTVIGVVSALLLPMANKFRPDPVKVKYLQTYDAITYVASQLANDSAKFGMYTTVPGTEVRASVVNTPFYTRSQNFCENFILGVNAPSVAVCEQEDELGQISRAHFITDNGVEWDINVVSICAQALNPEFYAHVNAVINEQSFDFIIGADGQTYIADPQGLAYASTRSSWKNSDYDLDKYNVSVDVVKDIVNENLYKELVGDEVWNDALTERQRPRR